MYAIANTHCRTNDAGGMNGLITPANDIDLYLGHVVDFGITKSCR
jgi:hypothetical protein